MHQHTTPCDNCPFLKEMAGKFFSGRERPQEIVDALRADSHFQCHKTLNKRHHLICAGSMLTAQKGGDRPSQMARVSMRVGMLDWDQLKAEAQVDTTTFDSLDAFVEGHSE